MKKMPAAMTETAFPTIALNSADYGIGSVYMAKSMLTTDTINPVTVAKYTKEEIEALENGESIELNEGKVLALVRQRFGYNFPVRCRSICQDS